MSLEAQHAAVSSIANFILVETDDADNIEDQLAGNNKNNIMVETNDADNIEDQLAGTQDNL